MHVSRRSVDGATTLHGDVRITPQARVLTFETPFGGFVWNRPSAVLVERDAEVTRIPIFDMTRAIQVALFAVTVLAGAASLQRRKGRN